MIQQSRTCLVLQDVFNLKKCPPPPPPPMVTLKRRLSLLRNNIIQICHASVGIQMECLPEGGWFSRGRSPRENHPPEGRHSIRIPTLAWHICFIISNKPQFGKISMKTTMTAGRSAGAVEKRVCYNVKVTDDW